jgi:hypothetical protein
MSAVGPDRFDDVDFRMLEQPEPPRRPRLRRWMLAPLGAILVAGALAAGASALTGEDSAPAAPAKGDAAVPQAPVYRDFRDCDRFKHDGKREQRKLELRH